MRDFPECVCLKCIWDEIANCQKTQVEMTKKEKFIRMLILILWNEFVRNFKKEILKTDQLKFEVKIIKVTVDF